MVAGKLYGQSLVQPGRQGGMIESLLVMQEGVYELMPQHPFQPDAIRQRALRGHLNATQHGIEKSIGPGRAARDALK